MGLICNANVKGLKPTAKIVLAELTDLHNKEGGHRNPTAQRLADECGMGCATLFRHMMTLVKCGLVTRHASGDGGRRSNQYQLHLDITLGSSARSKRDCVSNRDENLRRPVCLMVAQNVLCQSGRSSVQWLPSSWTTHRPPSSQFVSIIYQRANQAS